MLPCFDLTWTSTTETGTPTALAAVVHASAGARSDEPVGALSPVRLDEAKTTFQPDFALPTTLTVTTPSSDERPPELWRSTTA